MIYNYEPEPSTIDPEIEVVPDTPEKETPVDDPYEVPRPHPDADPEPKA